MSSPPLAGDAATPRIDLGTMAGIAALVYVASTLLHEAGGHGLACLAVGGRPTAWGAYYFDCDLRGLPPAASRLVSAAGSTVNLLVALACRAAWRRTPAARGTTRLVLWLAFTVNAYQWAGYYLFSGVSGLGDWGTDGVLAGVAAPWLWRAFMVAVGAVLYYWWIAGRAARALADMLGGTAAARREGQRVSTVAYLTGGAVSVLVGLLNPLGVFVVLASAAAASLGGAIGLLFLSAAMPRDDRRGTAVVGRDVRWIAVGAAAAIAYAVLLGRSVTFGR